MKGKHLVMNEETTDKLNLVKSMIQEENTSENITYKRTIDELIKFYLKHKGAM